MKLTIRRKNDNYFVYIPKKDLELDVVEHTPEGVFGGTFVMSNGWKIYIQPMEKEPRMPKTLDVKLLNK